MAVPIRQGAAMDDDTRRAIGLFRFGVLGPLVSAQLKHGDRTAYFAKAAARRHVMPPDGPIVQLSPRTIESWFHRTSTTPASTEVARDVRAPDRLLACASDLHVEPPLGPLLLLELTATVAANALRARHVAIEGDFHPTRPTRSPRLAS